MSRLIRLVGAFSYYCGDHGTFPPSAIVTKDGKTILSWRVLLLPYLGEEKLFREFQLTEPWDSQHNTKLLRKMPEVFAPAWGEGAEANCTPWQVFAGKGTIFDGTKGCSNADITDGSSNTILVAEGARLVPWTKPEDLQFDDKKDVPRLGFMFQEIFLFALADGSTHVGTRAFDQRAMRAAITRNGRDAIDFEKLLGKDVP